MVVCGPLEFTGRTDIAHSWGDMECVDLQEQHTERDGAEYGVGFCVHLGVFVPPEDVCNNQEK